jgi:hypothetical protein
MSFKKIFDIRRHYYYRVDKTQSFSFPNSELYIKNISFENYQDIHEYYPKHTPKFYNFIKHGDKGIYGYINGRLAAYAWAILNKQNSPKKVCGYFHLPGNAAFVHFCRVMDDFKGKKIYQTMLAHLYTKLFQEINDIYIDTDIDNYPANQAIKKSNGIVMGKLTRVICLKQTVITLKK